MDRNSLTLCLINSASGRPPCEGVDRNDFRDNGWGYSNGVALRARAWIETRQDRPEPCRSYVALRARAWIETLVAEFTCSIISVALRARAWIETGQPQPPPVPPCCRPPCEGVDRNLHRRTSPTDIHGRPPCEGVDRNSATTFMDDRKQRRPPCEGVDRNHSVIEGR
ncbi:protein of unknown function (plasmid) [Rhodovastum atsumiense]|nr:protein of unknown function [Rhodovastum atsumiense]